MECIMKKIRLYLDSTIVSALYEPGMLERMQETLMLWTDIKNGKYEVVFSEVLFEELLKCKQPKKDVLLNYLNEVTVYIDVETNTTINIIADEIIKLGILTANHRYDCLHIGSAIYAECDCIISWNFRHLVNYKTIKGVRVVTGIFNYKNIDILSPTMMINKEK